MNEPDIDTSNRQFVGFQDDDIVILMPKVRMSRQEALLHAAWIVALADQKNEFPRIFEAVCNT